MKVILILSCVCFLSATVYAKKNPDKLHCYWCDSTTMKECGDPLDSTYLPVRTCAFAGDTSQTLIQSPLFSAIANQNVTTYATQKNSVQCSCFKAVVTNKYGDKIEVARGSAIGGNVNDETLCKLLDDSVKKQSKNLLHIGFCHTCDSELCNNAGTVSVSILTLLSAIISYALIV